RDRRDQLPRQEGLSHPDPLPGFGNPPRQVIPRPRDGPSRLDRAVCFARRMSSETPSPAPIPPPPTTGLPRLDAVMHGITPGDNIVWLVDEVEEYRALVMPCAEAALAAGRQLHYFRSDP